MVKHSQITQSNKSALSLQNFKIRKGVHFLHTDKHQSFYKLALSILMEVARHFGNIFEIYYKKNYHNFFYVLLWCKTFRYFMRIQSLVIFKCHPVVITCFWVVAVKNGCSILNHRTQNLLYIYIYIYISRINRWNELIFCMLIQN